MYLLIAIAFLYWFLERALKPSTTTPPTKTRENVLRIVAWAGVAQVIVLVLTCDGVLQPPLCFTAFPLGR